MDLQLPPVKSVFDQALEIESPVEREAYLNQVCAEAPDLRQKVEALTAGENVELALATYNAGPTVVQRAGAAPSLGTLRYAKNVEARAAGLAGCSA